MVTRMFEFVFGVVSVASSGSVYICDLLLLVKVNTRRLLCIEFI